MTEGEEWQCECHCSVLVFPVQFKGCYIPITLYMYSISHVTPSPSPSLPLSLPSLTPSLSSVYSYSSLDGMDDTFPNSHLAITTDTHVARQPGVTSGYLPAYMLANESHERAGRTAR